MIPKRVKRFSDDIMLYLFDLEPDDFVQGAEQPGSALDSEAVPQILGPASRGFLIGIPVGT